MGGGVGGEGGVRGDYQLVVVGRGDYLFGRSSGGVLKMVMCYVF